MRHAIMGGGAPKETGLFTPSSYSASITIVAGTAQSGAIADGAKKIQFSNVGGTTEDVLISFGTSSADAIANLTVLGGIGTTGYFIPPTVDSSAGVAIVGVPSNGAYYAVVNANAADTPTVKVIQGV